MVKGLGFMEIWTGILAKGKTFLLHSGIIPNITNDICSKQYYK